jgi:phasin family protein
VRHEASVVPLSRHRLCVRRPTSFFEGFPVMAKKPAAQVAETASKAVTKSGEAAEKIVKGNADALAESGNASRAAIQELTKAYQELASKNAKNLTAAMQALAAVKSPTEFMELQQRLIKEGVAAAVSDSKHIAQLTTAVFTAAFEPVKKQIESVHKTART